MAGKNKASKFDGMTDDQILAKAKALEDKFRNVPARERPQDFYDFGNKAVEINRARRAARENARTSKKDAFNTGLTTTWGVPKDMETTRNRLAALIMQESGPRADADPEYTLLGERLVASALRNYMSKYGLTASELISGKGRYGGPRYLTSLADIQEHPERSVYDWATDKFKQDMFVHDDTTFNHMTNATRLASALVNGTLRPLTTATNFKHLAPDEEFDGMTKVDYDFGATPVPTDKVLKLYIDPSMKRVTRQDAKGGNASKYTHAADGAEDPLPSRMGTGRDKRRHDILLGELVNPTKDNKFFSGMGPIHLTKDDIKSNPDLYGLHDGWYDTSQVTRPQYEGKDGTVYMPGLATRRPQQMFKEGDGIGFGTANELGWTKPNAWLSDSREVSFTDHNVFGEPIKNPKYPKPRMAEYPKPRMAEKAGDAGPSDTSGVPSGHDPATDSYSGPRIVINPTTFHNKKDALCTAFNEGFRIWMEATGFEPKSEPTDAQRKFFSDTAYADDEVQLRRTILARIATFDTSVKDPTDDQLAETGSFLDAVLESDWCKNEWERNCVYRLAEAVKASVGAEPVEPRPEPVKPREPEPLQSKAALGGG